MTRIEELKARKAEIEELIKREEEAAKINKAAMFVPKCKEYWAVSSTALYGGYVEVHSAGGQPSVHVSRFRTREHAEAIAFARGIEDQMRAQPGCVVGDPLKAQWSIQFNKLSLMPVPYMYQALDYKLAYGQFGVFDTKEKLEAAIKTVGAENLIRAAKAKVGIY